MNLRILFVASLLAACSGGDDDDDKTCTDGDCTSSTLDLTDADTDSDTDSDTDADTDADTDSDTDADTDADTDTDTSTGDTGAGDTGTTSPTTGDTGDSGTTGPVEVCDNGIDDDFDAALDCDDTDCAADLACLVEDCANALDDDLDALADCLDPDCAAELQCQPEDCLNDVDDNGDGVVDCADATACGAEPSCAPELRINELLADPPDADLLPILAPEAGDANCDGVRDNLDDEFVEIVNVGRVPVDLNGGTVSDAGNVRHTFGATVLDPGDVIVVYGGGNLSGFPRASSGGWCLALPANARAVTASSGQLNLDNNGDTVTVDAGGAVESYTWGAEGNNDESLNRDPDLSTNALELHTTVAGSVGNYSPSRQVDLSDF